jgi:hypothetical protein
MIVFDLECRSGSHRFEGWFGSSDDFAAQQARGLLCCPQCGSPDVAKAPMAPRVARKGNQQVDVAPRQAEKTQPMAAAPPAELPMPPEAIAMMKKLARMQAEALKQSRWVGDSFAEDARAMHYGEREAEVIHGQATLEEAQDMLEEGIAVAPLPFPVAPPGKAN